MMSAIHCPSKKAVAHDKWFDCDDMLLCAKFDQNIPYGSSVMNISLEEHTDSDSDYGANPWVVQSTTTEPLLYNGQQQKSPDEVGL